MERTQSLRRRITKRRELPGAYEINVTPVLNLFICLIPFLLISAVFVQLSIIETDAPATSTATSTKAVSLAMVIISNQGMTVAGFGPIMKANKGTVRLPKKGKSYDYNGLTKLLEKLKQSDPKAEDLLIMAAPDIRYETIIAVMDAARQNPDGKALFPKAFFGGITS